MQRTSVREREREEERLTFQPATIVRAQLRLLGATAAHPCHTPPAPQECARCHIPPAHFARQDPARA
eukprot:3926193-Rhodomonas_salina.1